MLDQHAERVPQSPFMILADHPVADRRRDARGDRLMIVPRKCPTCISLGRWE
jgi:hypothetical protein